MSSNEKILLMRLSNSNLPTSEQINRSNTIDKIDFDKQIGNDFVFYLDSSSMSSSVNLNPSFMKLIEKINTNIDLDSARKKLDLDEKSIQISMLEEEKIYKSELNKYDLMQKAIDVKNKTADFEYSNKLRDFLLDSINNGDYARASFLNLCLNNHTDLLSSYFCQNNLNSNFLPNQINNFNDLALANNNISDEESINEDAKSNNTNVNNGLYSGTELGEVINTIPEETIIDDDIENEIDLKKDSMDKQLFNFKNGQSMLKLSLANKNIRHLICSTSKLEDYSNNSAITILFKGKCQDSNICHRKELHCHYLIDCTNCRRHISLYFQTTKYGLKFYKTNQIKSQAELDKIIRTFRMKSVRECM